MSETHDISFAKTLPGVPVCLQDFLHRQPVTVVPQTPIGWALEIMAENKIGSVIVSEPEGGRPVGILTLRDVLCRVALPGVDLGMPVESVMTPEPYSIPGRVSVGHTAREMARLGVRHLLVTNEDGALIGVVSRNDLYEWMWDSCAAARRAKAPRRAGNDAGCLAALMGSSAEQDREAVS